MENKVISIDGPSGSGKTSIGKMLSKRLDAHFLSSGLIYRMLVVSISNISKDDAYKKYINDISKFYNDCIENRFTLEVIDFNDSFISIRYKENQTEEEFIYKTKFIDKQLYSAETSILTSKFSQLRILRNAVSAYLNKYVQKNTLSVVEGRDIGSVVFKDAVMKIYIDSPVELRAKRRLSQSSNKEGIDNIVKRDEMDKMRDNSPLIVPDGAFILLNEDQSLEEIVDLLEDEYRNL